MSSSTKVPRIVAGVDVRRLPLRSVDVLVLSRIDGESAIDELADVLGMSEDEVDAAIGRLDLLGAIEWHDRATHGARTKHVAPPQKPIAAPRAPERTASPTPVRNVTPERPTVVSASPPRERLAPPVTAQPVAAEPVAAEPVASQPVAIQAGVQPPSNSTPRAPAVPTGEDVDFDPERRARIDFLTSKLEGLDHYSLLGLGSDAEKNDIRNAYFGLSKQFHPDTAFGKKLGPYKGRMEAIFNRLTEAYDVLSKSKRRAEYDEALKRRGQFPVTKPAIPPAGVIEPSAPKGDTKSGAQSLGRAQSEPPRAPVAVPAAQRGESPPTVSAASPPADVPTMGLPKSDHARVAPEAARPRPAAFRDEPPAAVQSMRASYPPPAAPTPPTRITPQPSSAQPTAPTVHTPPPPTQPRPGDTPQRVAARPQGPAGHTLRNLASTLKAAGQVTGSTDRVQRYLKDARAAEADNDFSQALNCLRLARQLAPDRADLATEYERVYRVFVTTHADDLRRRALADEKAGKLAEATQAWLRVCDGRPNDLEAYYAAGRSALASRTELPRTRGYLQRAVSIAPHVPEGRILLARLYLANGQKVEAVREAESAAKLYPDDQMLKNLIRELKA